MKPDIMVICESWLTAATSSAELSVSNYELSRFDRKHKRGGGVCVYTSERSQSTTIQPGIGPPDFLECLWSFLPLHNVVLLSIYIPPGLTSAETETTIEYVVSTADSLLVEYRDSRLIIVGDLNRFPTKEVERTFSLIQIVDSPTRDDKILDKVLIDSSFIVTSLDGDNEITEKPFEVIICPKIGNTDHETVHIKPTVVDQEESRWIKAYDFRESHINAFRKELHNFPWHKLYRANVPIDRKCDIFYEVIEEALQKIPYDLVEMKPSDKPWLTPTIKSLINKRFQAYRQRNFKLYHHFKGKLKYEIQCAKQNWASRKCKDPNGLWSVVNDLMNKRSQTSIQKITDSYPSLTSAANAVNKKFEDHFSKPPDWNSILEDLKSLPPGDWSSQINVNDILELLLKINPRKAAGSDGLHPKLIRAAAFELAEPVAHLFALSIQSGKVPQRWKLADVVAVPKSKPPSIDNLRPISLLPVLSKLLEKTVLKSIMPNLLRLYGPQQFGFRPGTSTLHAHIAIHDYTTCQMDNDESTGVLMIAYDMRKAFDTLSHEALLQSLRDSDLPVGFIHWCSDFLRDRKQRVRILHETSSTVDVTSGVPQGSVLAPCLFAAHMGKLEVSDKSCLTIKYADDIVMLTPVKKTTNIDKIVEEKIHEIESWCSTHGLVLNKDKTKSLLFRKPNTPAMQLSAGSLSHGEELRVLGVIYQTSLSWAAHIDQTCRRASQRLYIIRKLKPLVSRENLLQIYNSLIVGIFDYCSPLLIGMNQQDDRKIESLRKRCHRIICSPDCRCDLLKSLTTRRNTFALKVFKQMANSNHILHHLIPEQLPRSNTYRMPYCKTNRRLKSFIPFCIQLYNNSSNTDL